MPRGRPRTQDQTTLQMALVGYEIERQRIDDKIREIQSQLGIGRGRPPAVKTSPARTSGSRKRTMSAAARARIAAAQRKRWAEHRKRMGQA